MEESIYLEIDNYIDDYRTEYDEDGYPETVNNISDDEKAIISVQYLCRIIKIDKNGRRTAAGNMLDRLSSTIMENAEVDVIKEAYDIIRSADIEKKHEIGYEFIIQQLESEML